MAVQNSVAARNARLDAFETAIGGAPILELRTGAQPANCAAVATGTLLAQFALPADWLAAAANGVKAKNGTWSGAGVGAGDIGYYRIYGAGSPSECHEQGSVTATGGGGDMTVDNITIAAAQVITVTAYNRTAGNA
jgi:hypothetical protein